MSSSFLSIGPNLVLSPFPDRTRTLNPLLHRTHHLGLSHRTTPFLRGNLSVAKVGFNQLPFSDPDAAEGLIRDLFGRAEGLFYTIADAAVSASPENVTTSKQSNDWFSGITNYMEFVLKVLKDGLSAVHVPYSYGFAIILLTVLVKAATFPLTKKQVESSMAMRSLQPQIKAIQERYAGDQEKIQLETARIYKLAGINPLAGCLPTLATIPVWIGLYRALSNVADEGLLTEGFFWIPSLAGPTTIAARQSGGGISWLFPFIDGHPPLGWSDTFAYLVLPVLLVLSQYISIQIMQSSQSNDPNMKSSQAITKLLPLMIGYFSLSVPSGLSLYWFTNNILSTAQQVWLQKLGGAKNKISKITDSIMKEDRSQIQKTTLETTTAVKEPRAEQSTSGPRPGERFRQLKEQEEKRKRQKEEERRKAEEVAANATQVTNGAPNKEASSVQRESNSGGQSSDLVNGNLTNGFESSSSIISSNGDLSTVPSKDDQKTSILEVDDEGKGQHLHENAEKDAVGTVQSADRKASSEDPTGDRSE